MRNLFWLLGLLAVVAWVCHPPSSLAGPVTIDGIRPGFTREQVRAIAGAPYQDRGRVWEMSGGAFVVFEDEHVKRVSGHHLTFGGHDTTDPARANFKLTVKADAYQAGGLGLAGSYERPGDIVMFDQAPSGRVTYTLGP